MRIDTYTKAVLTIIAVALVWIAAGGTNVVPAVEAQDRTPTRVVIVGWEQGGSGAARALPLPVREQPDDARPTNTRVVVAGWIDRTGTRHEFPRPMSPELARERGRGMPITAVDANLPTLPR